MHAPQFVVDVVVRRGSDIRHIGAAGHTSTLSPLRLWSRGAVRLLDGSYRRPGAVASGEAFDADALLAALERNVESFVVLRDWHQTDRSDPN